MELTPPNAIAAAVPPVVNQWFGLRRVELLIAGVAAAAVLILSHAGWWSIGPVEAWGFATGGICVWLVVREHIANWPIGLANNLAFVLLFWHGRLYADMGLQVVYFGLGIYGWWQWLHGGRDRTALTIQRASRRELAALAVTVPLATLSLRQLLVAVDDAAPLLDALTTALSLAAQFLLCRKRIENWWLWLAADVIYVPLYIARGMRLTAVLYAVFFLLCVVGLRAWRRSLGRSARA